MQPSLSSDIHKLIEQAIQHSIFPGAVVLIAANRKIIHHQAYGTTMYQETGSQPVTIDTIYDIASLTKVFTATAALRLYDQGRLDLQAPVATILPEVHDQSVQVEHLLTHTSGLDVRLSALRHRGRQGLLDAVYATARQHLPGSTVAYSNVNTLLLGEIVARVYASDLDAAVEQLVLQPLGLQTTQFCPTETLQSRIAPTEFDHDWRGRLVHGTVHDESTHALGGIAGHAGLFSTTTDLLRFCQAWLDDWLAYDQQHLATGLIKPTTARLATTNQTPTLRLACGLGWMLDRPNFMGAVPHGSFGHTGFTGPAMVVVPTHKLVVVVVNNRVYPMRRPPEHQAVIAAITEAAVLATLKNS
jgi:CubicO group peptidase (beta-lactamase class C family)